MNAIRPIPRDLAEIFVSRGYIRVPKTKRIKEGHRTYKKGWEVRIPVYSVKELRLVRRLLKTAGFKQCKPYEHGRFMVQPVYGREAVKRFSALKNR